MDKVAVPSANVYTRILQTVPILPMAIIERRLISLCGKLSCALAFKKLRFGD